MISAVDTNVLLDVLIPNTAHLQSSLSCLLRMGHDDELVICETVYAELGSQFLSSQDLDKFLYDTAINMVSSNEKSLFEASSAWKKYGDRKKNMIVCQACGKAQKGLCRSCGEVIPYRQHILADLFEIS